ncbi:Lrp/AsnC family transcriptional regulator [Rhodococcus sp. IEGM 1379]|uniref:Lrp/AsnC family transcriptional regulator n=1 Tax=Rhodococcus sp. IEGM 1379 TaxID=3047086 RepID=UPI0024B7A9DD|nr:Lrp/AsnC family transcriptional regulator [Rhodococcus sp. IEGM 1379]MDI9917883.1 Lrp/AsnC family transcriptional regulator [Rhodococcus sp. IEGM 1379]
MQESTHLDEIDLRIVHAMQVQPRASWALIGSVVGVDPVTAARRWKTLTDSGAAWIAAYPAADAASVLAFLDIRCEPRERANIVAHLSAQAHVMSLNIHSGGSSVMAEALFAGLDALARYVLDELHVLDGVIDIGVHPVTRVFTEGSRWRLGTLEPAGVRTLRESGVVPPPLGRRNPLDSNTAAVIDVLGRAPRISITELAHELGISVTAARRRLGRALSHHTLLRCELARFATGRPIRVLFFAQSPVRDVDNAARILRALPEIRLVATVAGPENLFFSGWFRSLSDIAVLESEVSARAPTMRVVDRRIVLDTPKLMGHLLDREGRSVAVTPVRVRS